MDGPAKARVISGVYDLSRDADEYLAVASLADAFDVLIHIRRVTPVRWLPCAAPHYRPDAEVGRRHGACTSRLHAPPLVCLATIISACRPGWQTPAP